MKLIDCIPYFRKKKILKKLKEESDSFHKENLQKIKHYQTSNQPLKLIECIKEGHRYMDEMVNRQRNL